MLPLLRSSALLVLFGAHTLVAASSSAESPLRERVLFTKDWKFTRNTPGGTPVELDYFKNPKVREAIVTSSTSTLSEELQTLGADCPFTQPSLDDKDWRVVSLPHDWGIEGPFDQKLPGETGKLPWMGIGWYRKQFTLPASDAGRRIYLDVDGAMAYSMIWCNGRLVGGWPYGYASFRLDLTPYLKPGAQNTLAVRLSNPDQSSRWYPGSGIYRNVWLVKTNPVHVSQWGTYITTTTVSAEEATVSVKTKLENRGTQAVDARVTTLLFRRGADGNETGAPVAKAITTSVSLPPAEQKESEAGFEVQKPSLWDVKDPAMYVAVTTVEVGKQKVDEYRTPFGIRTIAFDPDNGFLLNGRRVQLNGVCNHHDLGALGSAFNVRAAERQLEILKEMGGNALRTSHNPPAPELLDLCDRMGILVMDESFDCWATGKKGNDYHKLWDDWHVKDLTALVVRDRNHPSVILWSIGNEVIELRDNEAGPRIAAELTSIVNGIDPTRRTVLGSNSGGASYNGIQKAVGVMGQNYQMGNYGRFKRENPAIPLVGSETSSCVSSRGEYFFQTEEQAKAIADEAARKAAEKGKPAPSPVPFSPVPEDKSLGRSDFQVSSYDLYAPGWAYPPDKEFRAQMENPFVAGEFVWTGFDYLGEPTPYNGDSTNLLNFHDPASLAEMQKQLAELGKIKVPSRSSYFGIVDLAGFKKDRFYSYQAHWRPELPMAHILPHWNWPERVGKVTPVHVYTSGDEAELFLNGKSLGRKTKQTGDFRLRWDDVVYSPGELKVVAYKGGKEWATDVQKTTGTASKLTAAPDRKEIRNDGTDLSFVTITVSDKDGLLVPRSKNAIQFEMEGPGEIVAVDNGDATSFEPFQAMQRKAYNGLALAIVRAKAGAKGVITLRAKSDGLAAASCTIETR